MDIKLTRVDDDTIQVVVSGLQDAPPIMSGGKIKVYSTAYIEDLTVCEYLLPEYWNAILKVSEEIAVKFPTRKAPKLEITDACALVGDCDGHPGNSHGAHGRACDYNYYTWGDTNHTGVRHKSHDAIGRIVQIWDDDVLNGMFDHWRNRDFVLALKRILPKVWFRMDERIKTALMDPSSPNERKILDAAIQGDPPHAYAHDTHMHVECWREN